MAVYLPIRAISRSQAVRINGQKILDTATSYVDISKTSVKREVQNHSALGAIVVVGSLTASNSDQVVTTGGVVTVGAGDNVNVTAGEMRTRSTGVYVAGASATNHALTACDGTQDRTDLIWWDAVSGAVGHTNGALAGAGLSVAPATPAGKTPLATALSPAAGSAPTTITDVRPRA